MLLGPIPVIDVSLGNLPAVSSTLYPSALFPVTEFSKKSRTDEISLFHLTDSRIDLERIWQKQTVGEPILEVLEPMSEIVNEHIRNTMRNVTEYCKKEECWNRLKTTAFQLQSNLSSEYIRTGTTTIYSPNISSEREAIEFCESKGASSWFELSKWLKEHSFLTPKARSQCFNMGKFVNRGKHPSVALSKPCQKIWEEAEIRGWNGGQEVISEKE
jgi:hypothetical protein